MKSRITSSVHLSVSNHDYQKGKNIKGMSKKILLLFLLFTGFVNAQIVTIPDVNFKAKLIALGVDTNSDGNIQNSEALAITTLSLWNSNISNLTGIEAFTNLTSLDCYNNQLTSLNVSNLINLTSLWCSNNLITSVDINNLTNLTFFNCRNNLISSLNLNSLTNLTSLWCSNNLISSLNLNSLTNLTSLDCSNNQLTSLNVSNLINLTSLGCSNNLISSLDINSLTNLLSLYCENNPLTLLNISPLSNLESLSFGNPQLNTVDVNSNTNLQELYFHGGLQTSMNISNLNNLYILDFANTNLTAIDASHNPNIVEFFISNNPNLNYLNVKDGTDGYIGILNCPNLINICANETEIAFVNSQLISGGGNNPNAVVTSYCTFTPGGNYNTITGTTHFDSNNNGCTTTDPAISNVRININDGTNQGATFTNTNGNYTFYVQQPNLTFSPILENPTYFTVSPATATLNFPTNNNTTQTQNFCISTNGVHNDVEIVLVPSWARPGYDAHYQLVYKNKGNQTLSGTVNIAFDDAKTDFVTATPAVTSQATGALSWNYVNLLPFETRVINFTLNVNTPLETPAVNPGDILDFMATINPVTGDEIPTDNIFTLHQTVVSSFDPNDKTCLEGATVSPTEIGKYLHYNINFENTGTASAVNVVVKDIIDTTKFDISTLQVMYASHQVRTVITGNKVEFIFEGINLAAVAGDPPVGGHGNVLFKIKTKNNLVVGNQVANTANIYFDYNAPIITNEALTTFAVLSNPAFEIDNSVLVYPNPATTQINISAKSSLKSIQLFDIQGRVLETVLEDKKTTTFDISNKANGVYFLKITTEEGSKVEKVVKE
jgi:Leucine-rich repeat (LRR) protein